MYILSHKFRIYHLDSNIYMRISFWLPSTSNNTEVGRLHEEIIYICESLNTSECTLSSLRDPRKTFTSHHTLDNHTYTQLPTHKMWCRQVVQTPFQNMHTLRYHSEFSNNPVSEFLQHENRTVRVSIVRAVVRHSRIFTILWASEVVLQALRLEDRGLVNRTNKILLQIHSDWLIARNAM